MMEEMKKSEEITFNWYIPSIKDVLNSQLELMQVTVKSEFKVKLNFANLAEDQLNIYVLPLIPVDGFKLMITRWLKDPRRQPDDAVDSAIVKLPVGSFECAPPNNWILCQNMSVKQLKNEITAYYNAYDNVQQDVAKGVNAIGINFDLKFYFSTKVKDFGNETLSNDFEKLLISEKFHDAVIQTKEGKEFKVHKNIVAARSEVFNAAFQHNTVETTTNIIATPFDNETIESLLLFLYCNKTPNINKIAGKLLVAADYYHMKDLVNKCAETLVAQLTHENALESLELALKHSCSVLEEGIFNFINDANIADIVQSEVWDQMSNVEVFKKICKHFVVMFHKI